MKKIPLITSLLAISLSLSFFAVAADEEIKGIEIAKIKEGNNFIKENKIPPASQAEQASEKENAISSSNAPASQDFFVGEETITLSIINFGRKNPFKPYTPAIGISIKEKEEETIKLDDIPSPPVFQGETSQEIQELMASRVNGILFDPYARSVAIVNIKGTEHMLHKGDIVSGIMLNDISENYITLKYGTNTYTVGVGEIVEGEIKTDSVQRKQKIFAGSDYDLPDLNLEEIDK